MGSRRSFTGNLRCAGTGTTTDCVEYQGVDIPCLEICTGDTLTYVENQIATKVCELVGLIDMTDVVLPACLLVAWATNDPTILNFIQFILDQHCLLQTQVDALPTTNNPIITLDYKCCATNPCIVGQTFSISDHLQNILICLCAQHDLIVQLQTDLDATLVIAQNALATAQAASAAVVSWTNNKSCILSQTSCD